MASVLLSTSSNLAQKPPPGNCTYFSPFCVRERLLSSKENAENAFSRGSRNCRISKVQIRSRLVLNFLTRVRKHKHPPEQALLWLSDLFLTSGCWLGKYLRCIWALSSSMGEVINGIPRVWSSPCCSRVTPWRPAAGTKSSVLNSQELFVSSQQAPRTRIPLLPPAEVQIH